MRILKRAALIFSYLIAFSCLAQKEITTIDFPYRSMQHFEFSKNQNGDYCLFVNKEEFYYFCYISKNGEKVYDTTIKEYSSVKPAFLGVKPGRNNFIYYFLPAYAKRNLKIITITQNKNDCNEQSGFEFFSSKKEEIVEAISYGSNFYLVTANKPSGSIFISSFIDESKFEKKEYPLSINFEFAQNHSSFSENSIIKKLLTREFLYSGYENLNLLYSKSKGDKFIIDNSSIHFLFIEGDVLTLNLDTNTYIYNAFYEDIPSNSKDFHSHIIGNNLFRVIASSKEFLLRIYKLDSGSLVKEYKYTQENEFNLPSYPLKKIHRSKNDSISVEDTISEQELLRKLSQGISTIYGFKSSENFVHLFIGSKKNTLQITTIPIILPAKKLNILTLPIPSGLSPIGNIVSIYTILSLPNFNIVHPLLDTIQIFNSEPIYWPEEDLLNSFKGEIRFSETTKELYVLLLFNDKKQLVITEFEK